MSVRYFRSSGATICFHYGRRRQFLSPSSPFPSPPFPTSPSLSLPAVFFFPSLPPSFSLTHFIPFSNPFPSPFFPPLLAPVNTFCGTWYLPYSQVHSDRTVCVVTVILHILHSACACAKRPHFHFMFLDSYGDCIWRGWQRSVGSSFHRQSAAYRKERLLIFKEDRVGGRARVAINEERMLWQRWTEIKLWRYWGWFVVRTLYVIVILLLLLLKLEVNCINTSLGRKPLVRRVAP